MKELGIYIRNNYGAPPQCRRIIDGMDCIGRGDHLCPSCDKMEELINEFNQIEMERKQSTAVRRAAIALIVAESELMGTPLSVEDVERLSPDVGDLLDLAHKNVHLINDLRTMRNT